MRLSYRVDLTNPWRRRFGVELRWQQDREGTLDLMLPVWTPGSYLVREYSRLISDVQARGPSGQALAVCKTRKNRYAVNAPAGLVTICYTVYGHELTVRTNDVTAQHALIQGAATFLWPLIDGQPWQPTDVVEIAIDAPDDWKVACALPAAGDHCHRVTDLHELVDSPFLVGSFDQHEFDVNGTPHRLVFDNLAPMAAPLAVVDDTRRIIKTAAAVFGGDLPYREYTFMTAFAETGRGGLEHRDCSVLLAPRSTFSTRKDYVSYLGLVAHEFFHVWNVKRMRPAEFMAIDYENETYTELLWVAEGFTAYYDDLICRRAGILDTREYLDLLADHIADLRRTQGRFHHSLSGASFDAWIRLYRPDEDTRNSTFSYYGNGALAALLIDLRIRTASSGARDLDDAMRRLYGQSAGRDRGYTRSDVDRCISQAAGEDLAPFIASLVDGKFDPDFASPLSAVGIQLLERPSKLPFLGIGFESDGTKIANVRRDSPADAAGLSPGDEVLAVDGLRVNQPNWATVLESRARIDSALDVLISRRGIVQSIRLTPGPAPNERVELLLDPVATPTALALRKAWINA